MSKHAVRGGDVAGLLAPINRAAAMKTAPTQTHTRKQSDGLILRGNGAIREGSTFFVEVTLDAGCSMDVAADGGDFISLGSDEAVSKSDYRARAL